MELAGWVVIGLFVGAVVGVVAYFIMDLLFRNDY